MMVSRITAIVAGAWLCVSVGCSSKPGAMSPAAETTAAGTAAVPAAGAGTSAAPIAGAGAAGAAGRSSATAGTGAAGRTAAAGGGGAGMVATNDDDAGAVMPKAGSPAVTPDPPPMDAGMMGMDATVAEPRMDLGKGDGRDVITIGDSWMNNTLLTGGAIEGALDRLTMQRYRHYAVQGVLLLQASAFGAAIPSQYASAKRQDPNIKTVLMTGGGNDIIQNASVQASCSSGGDACKQKLMEINEALNKLWTQMAEDGVQDVVMIRYSDDAGSTDPSLRGMATMPPAICLTGKIRCHGISSTEAVMGDLQDGIHPTRAANDRLAKVIWDYMVAKGIRR